MSETESKALHMDVTINNEKARKEMSAMQKELTRALGHNPSASMILVNQESNPMEVNEKHLRASGVSGVEQREDISDLSDHLVSKLKEDEKRSPIMTANFEKQFENMQSSLKPRQDRMSVPDGSPVLDES